MGKQILRKGRRVFSLEPNKVAYTMFARNYVKHLMTSLVKISSNNPSHHHQQQQIFFQKLVKFEVDMAMALSASEFAWGIALKKKLLQREVGNGNVNNGNFGNESDFDHFSLQTVKFSQENLGGGERGEEGEEEEAGRGGEEEEDKKMENGLMKLRKIIPGGGDFNIGGLEEEDLLKQTESYVKCLELQVNVLRGLVETNTF